MVNILNIDTKMILAYMTNTRNSVIILTFTRYKLVLNPYPYALISYTICLTILATFKSSSISQNLQKFFKCVNCCVWNQIYIVHKMFVLQIAGFNIPKIVWLDFSLSFWQFNFVTAKCYGRYCWYFFDMKCFKKRNDWS